MVEHIESLFLAHLTTQCDLDWGEGALLYAIIQGSSILLPLAWIDQALTAPHRVPVHIAAFHLIPNTAMAWTLLQGKKLRPRAKNLPKVAQPVRDEAGL